jgi:hypothetical protein
MADEWTTAAHDDSFPHISQENNYEKELGGTFSKNLPAVSVYGSEAIGT